MITRQTLAAAILFATSCVRGASDVSDPTSNPTGATPVTTEPEPTEEPTSDLSPIEAVMLAAEFGYDAELQRAVSANVGGAEYPPEVDIVLGTNAYMAGTAPDEGCTVYASAAEGAASRASFADDAGLVFGFVFPGPLALDLANCRGVIDLDEAERIALDLVAPENQWGVGLQAEPAPESAALLAQVGWTPFAVGGGLAIAWGEPGAPATVSAEDYDPTYGYAFGLAMTAEHDLDLSSGGYETLMASELLVDGQLQTAFYYVGEFLSYPAE